MLYDVIIIGGGQSGLAAAYYLKRTGLSFLILDAEENSGGAWQHYWKSLRLFSPAQWSSLPGVIMPGGGNYYPTRDEAIEYIRQYEEKYNFPVERPVQVLTVQKKREVFELHTSKGTYSAKAIISATGSFKNPHIPNIPGINNFEGTVIHASQYTHPEAFSEKRVAVIGEGNSGAQILAEVSLVADTFWVTQKEPRFLPDNIDGRYLFDAATQMYEAKKQGKIHHPPSLGDIVMVPPVKGARDRSALKSVGPLQRLGSHSIILSNEHEEKVDALIFCTGYKPALAHLSPLDIVTPEGKVNTAGTRAKDIQGLWLVGYGNWTGFASATLIGVGRSAKKTVEEIQTYVSRVSGQ